MKRVLIIPDVHGRPFWRKSIDKFLADYPLTDYANKDNLIIFLGDYLDPYTWHDGITNRQAYDNFVDMLAFTDSFRTAHPDNIVMLFGNHDLHYFFDTGEDCRLDHARYDIYRDTFADRVRTGKFAVAHSLRMSPDSDVSWLFTHAGVVAKWFGDMLQDTGLSVPSVSADSVAGVLNDNVDRLLPHLAQVSWHRGGPSDCGSCLWADLNEMRKDNNTLSLLSLRDGNGRICQVFSHTYSEGYIDKETGVFMLDTGFSSFVLDQNDDISMFLTWQ